MIVYFSEYPPDFEISPACNGMAIIRFYDHVETEEAEDCMRFRATCYETIARNSEQLSERIQKNPSLWREKAKEDMAKRLEDEHRKQLEQAVPERITELETAQDEMILMMAELIGGE